MVVTANKKLMLLAVALVINASLVFGQAPSYERPEYAISGLVQYGENIDRERLELLEDRQTIRIGSPYFITGTYIICNSGGEYRATLGILFDRWQSGVPYPAATEIQFFVNGNLVSYTEISTYGGIVFGERKRELAQHSTAWALIDVLFPENSITTIKVHYKNGIYSPQLAYNNINYFYFPELELSYWKGTTKFSVEIENSYIEDRYTAETLWISDIIFASITHDYERALHTSKYLPSLQKLETDLMSIHKVNGNTFKIEFTKKFMDTYRRSMIINFSLWGSTANNYIIFDYDTREINLGFLENNANISQRKLVPYELLFLTNNQLRIMRNFFYARHGYNFRSREIQNMFNYFFGHHYEINPDFHEGMLTEIDRANIETIRRLEVLTGE